MLGPRGGELLCQNVLGILESLTDIASFYVGMAQQIAGIMKNRGIVAHRLVGVSDAGKDHVADLHQLGSLLCSGIGFGCHQANYIAYISGYFPDCNHGIPVPLQVSDLHGSGNVVCGEDANYTRYVDGH